MGTAFVAAAALTLSPPALLAQAVAKNEGLYHALDVTYHSLYRLADGHPLAGGRVGLGGGVVLTEDRAVRVTHRGGPYRVLVTQRTHTGPGPARVRAFGSAFDGTHTRTREGETTDTRLGTRPLPREAFFPHLWATGPNFETFPLSVLLGGGEAWAAYPGRHPAFANPVLTTRVDGYGAIGGEPCVVARCHFTSGGWPGDTFLLWLAPRKNYLPLRVKKYGGVYSEVLPIEVVEAGDVREVRPGLWVPHLLTRTVYQELELRDHHRMVVSNTTTTAVTRIGSADDFTRTFFQELRADGE